MNHCEHLTANKTTNFVLHKKASTLAIMDPGPRDIVDLFIFMEVRHNQQSATTDHLPTPVTNSVTTKGKRQNGQKTEVTQLALSTENLAANGVQTPRPKAKATGMSQQQPNAGGGIAFRRERKGKEHCEDSTNNALLLQKYMQAR